MNKLFRVFAGITWGLGILGLIAGMVLRLAVRWGDAHWDVTPRGALIFAGVLFLCTLASRALAEQPPPV